MWLMFAGSPFKLVRPLKTIQAGDLHLPSVICLRADNENPPIAGAITKHMLNNCNHIPPPFRIPGIVHLYSHAHSESG